MQQPAQPLFRISAMQNLQGDRLVYSTFEGQLLMMKLADKPEDSGKVSYFIEPYHTRKITALAICLKKPLVVTAGVDNTLRLYNHNGGNQLKLQYVEKVSDPIESISLHPSGVYLVAASKSKLRYYTVCLKRFVCYHETSVVDCNVVRFCNGGHLFAAQEMNDVCVYKFFTGERPANYRFMFHIGGIRDIQWLPDDSGFASCSINNDIQVWSLKDFGNPEWVKDAVPFNGDKNAAKVKGY